MEYLNFYARILILLKATLISKFLVLPTYVVSENERTSTQQTFFLFIFFFTYNY